jgi:hypothetical protein
MTRGAHPEIASCVAATAIAFTGWAAVAGWLAQTLGELTALLRTAADHVDAHVARASINN